jgi:hypothetical protein
VSPTVLASQNVTPPPHPASAVPPLHPTANYQRPRSLEHHSSHSSLASDRLHNSWPNLASDRHDTSNRQLHQSSTIRESRSSPQDPHEERHSRHHHHHRRHGSRDQPPIQQDVSGERASGEHHDSHQNYYSGPAARERQVQLDPADRRATDPYLYHNSAPREQKQIQQDSGERRGTDHHSYGSVPRERQAQQEHSEHTDTQHRQHHGSTTWEQRPIQKDSTQNLIETFTSKIDLQPTFSPNIVRTPGHYRPLARHDSHEEFNKRESPNRAESRHASTLPSDGRIPGLGRPKTKASSIPQRQSSMPNVATSSFVPDSFAALPNFVDEPSNISALSPLLSAAPRSVSRASGRSQSDPSHGQAPQARPQTRSQTDSHVVGASLGTINENSREDQASRDAFRPAPSTSSNRPSPTSSSWKRSPNTNSSPNTKQHSPSYPNPLPRPPQETHNPATSAPLPPRIPPPPGTWKLRVRRGFWNRRGDFLTRDGFIVYAPEDKAYPSELEHYPEDAYVNETGDRIEYEPSRPELPESLPQRGRPPTQPYDTVSPPD